MSAYVLGMKALWRVLEPQAPTHTAGGAMTVQWVTLMGYGAVSLEALGGPAWASSLSAEEAHRAARHGLVTERNWPIWLDELIDAHPGTVADVVIDQLRLEWDREGYPTYVVNHLANVDATISEVLKDGIVHVFEQGSPASLTFLNHAVDIALRVSFNEGQKKSLITIAKARFHAARDEDPTTAMRLLARRTSIPQLSVALQRKRLSGSLALRDGTHHVPTWWSSGRAATAA